MSGANRQNGDKARRGPPPGCVPLRFATSGVIRSLSKPARGVLLVILGHADNGSGWSWPSVPTIARESGLTTRSVLRALGALEDRGALLIERTPGRGNRYRIPAPVTAGVTGDTGAHEPVTAAVPTGDTGGAPPVTLAVQTPDSSSHTNVSERSSGYGVAGNGVNVGGARLGRADAAPACPPQNGEDSVKARRRSERAALREEDRRWARSHARLATDRGRVSLRGEVERQRAERAAIEAEQAAGGGP